VKSAAIDMFVSTRPYPDAIDARLVHAQRSIAQSPSDEPPQFRTLRTGERRVYRTDSTRRLLAKERRDDLVAAGKCINGAGHGKATHGRLCRGCRETHRKSS
jgi:hypothetical protein